jgi:hypothetical protein
LEIKIDRKDIAFDFDGVMADTMGLFVSLMKKEYQRNDISVADITNYDLRKCLDVSEEILMDIGFRIISEDCYSFLRPIDGAVDVLTDYVRAGEKLLIITARPEKKPVELWVKNYLDIDESKFDVVATGDFNSKTDALHDFKKKYLVEDRIETCFHLKENGFEPVVFVQPWNRLPNNFIEVSSWYEISNLFG